MISEKPFIRELIVGQNEFYVSSQNIHKIYSDCYSLFFNKNKLQCQSKRKIHQPAHFLYQEAYAFLYYLYVFHKVRLWWKENIAISRLRT